MVAKIPMARLDARRWTCGTDPQGQTWDQDQDRDQDRDQDPRFRDQPTVDHAQLVLLRSAIASPSSWVWAA